MFLIHPILQSIGILITICVFILGFSRFRAIHLKHKIRFKWKPHVRLGLLASAILLIGIFGGLYTAKTMWYSILITGSHAKVGLLMIPFILFALLSGLYMDRMKKKRKILPLIHGIGNTLLLFLALFQIYSGVGVYQTYILGR
jgi:hypothetical protein